MSERSWTPGPWEVREVDGLFAIACPTGWVLESNDVEQDRADARLIAAAPEMFELLEEFYKYLSVHSKGSKQIKEIIKRVRGTDGS